ncbi:tail fiber domain-containing protein [Salmonella enterica]|nr:tail fiber domain-containing protein [Salmonella enterica]
MPIDDRTPRFDLELPAQSNTLRNDVQRLRSSFDKLAEKAAEIDPATNKLLDAHVPDDIPRLDANGKILAQYVNPAAVASLDADGKVDYDAIPDDAKMNIFDATTEVLMLDVVDAQGNPPTIGDVCNITTAPYRQYLMVKKDPKQRDSWRELPMQAVNTINGQPIPDDGAIVLPDLTSVTVDNQGVTKGVNTNISSLTGLSGPLTLGGDGLNDYDAVTMRQLKASSGGAAGANMTGIMTNFIGAVEWFNGTRPNYPAGHLPADGQCVERADAPDLWNAINGGMLLSVTDTEWLSGKLGTVNGAVLNSPGIHRGKYSKGGLAGTCPDKTVKGDWFRMPDLNGIQTGSLAGTFLRGSGGQPALTGLVASSSVPNIKGSMGTNNGWLFTNFAGAISATGTTSLMAPQTAPTTAATRAYFDFDASRVSSVYGRQEIYPVGSAGGTGIWSANEVRPNSVTGIWIIRANASFTAANTSFDCITSDAGMPGRGKSVMGGTFNSRYQVNGDTVAVGFIRAVGTVGASYAMRIGISTNLSGVTTTKNMDFNDNGDMNLPGGLNAGGPVATTSYLRAKNSIYIDSGAGNGSNSSFIYFRDTAGQKTMGSMYSERNGDITISTSVNGVASTSKYFQFMQDGNGVCSGVWKSGSDERLKSDITIVANPLKSVLSLRGATWIKDDGSKHFGIGLIAQDVQKICPEAVTATPDIQQSTGKVIKDPLALDAGSIAAAYHTEAIKELVGLIELALDDPDAARAKLAELKA